MVDTSVELVVRIGEIRWSGRPIEYDFKLMGDQDGALMVSLNIENVAKRDAFQRSTITGLVLTPEGDFHAYNAKFAIQLVRSGD